MDEAARARIIEGSVPLGVLRFGAPLAIGMGLQTTFNLVDAYLISRIGGETGAASIGALGICDSLSAIGTIVSYGVTTASTAMITNAAGRGDEARVRAVVWQSMLAIFALSIFFGGASIAFAGVIMHDVVGAKGAVADLGTTYLRINSGGAGAMFFLLQLTAVQRSLGSSKTPAALLVLSNALNLFLAVVLVYGPGDAPPVFAWGPPIARALHVPRLELEGAAWATIAARLITLVPVTWLLAKRFDVLKGDAKTRRPNRPLLLELYRIAWPSSTQLVVRILGMLLTQTLVARAFTSASDQTATIALGIVFRLEMMALFVAIGWGSAAQTYVGQNLGAGREERARKSGVWAAIYAAVLMAMLAIAYRVAGERIVAFFDSDPKVVAVAVDYVATISWSYVAMGAGVVLGSSIAGAGATKTTLATDLATVMLFQLPACAAAILVPGATLGRLFGAVAATYVVSAIVYVIVYRTKGWTSKGAALPVG